ncbi:MAG: gamma-glutamyltransferase [Candidatus Hydrogenedentes bacterium]|nr:gamma-glutamyltransferase [Candidatus Hydrogenedentota bacterium]
MAVSASRQASETGVAILNQEGNAFDAAAAMGFVLAVTHPQAGNLGGGGFLVARTAEGALLSLDFRETAPAKAHQDLFLGPDGEPDPERSLHSPLASGVPGSVDGLLQLWERHGSGNITRYALMGDAIRLAREGFPLTPGLAADLNGKAETFARNPAREVFVREDGRPWQAGDVLIQQDLALTLGAIAAEGREGFYAGRVARFIAEQQAATGGLITLEDLAGYRTVYREPVRGAFHDYEIVTMGPPSSGGVLLLQMLNMLEEHDLQGLGWGSSAYIHLLTEVQRRAYADRSRYLGDPEFWPVPLAALLSKDYARGRARSIDPLHATKSSDIAPGLEAARESPETTHYTVADQDRNVVAVTTTLNASFGSGIVIAGAGFLMNNEMDDFSAKPGAPNRYGLVGGEANAIKPGKRMLSSMTPTIVLKSGKPHLVLGSPGGSTIITTVLQNFLNVTVWGMNIQEAVSAPRHHSQWLPDEIVAEPRSINADTWRNLESMGHRLVQREGAIGQTNAIHITEEGLYGAPDPRGDNAAAGY